MYQTMSGSIHIRCRHVAFAMEEAPKKGWLSQAEYLHNQKGNGERGHDGNRYP